MPITAPLIVPTDFDVERIAIPIEEIRRSNPHRGSMEQLDGILRFDPEQKLVVGIRRIRPDAFWTEGHFPGNPILPGVLMVESQGQLCTYYYMRVWRREDGRPLGFAGLDGWRFRAPVRPGDTLLLVAKALDLRERRAEFATQTFCGTKLVAEGNIIGMPVRADGL